MESHENGQSCFSFGNKYKIPCSYFLHKKLHTVYYFESNMEDKTTNPPESLIGNPPTVEDVSKCGIPQLLKVPGFNGYPLIVLNPSDREYSSVLKSLLRRHKDRDPEIIERQNEACEQWMRKVARELSRPTGGQHPASTVCELVLCYVYLNLVSQLTLFIYQKSETIKWESDGQ